jgi:hypothetical protein
MGCGDDGITEPAPPPPDTTTTVSVVARFTPSTASPGDTTVLTVIATPYRTDARVNSIWIQFEQASDTALRFGPPPGPGIFRVELHLVLLPGPYEGQLDVTAWANVLGRADTTTTSLTIADTRPPQVVVTTSSRAEPGNDIRARVDVKENAALLHTMLTVRGALDFSEVVDLAGAREYGRTWDLQVPRDAALGDSIVIEAIAVDWKGLADTAEATIPVGDFQPPVVEASLLPSADTSSVGRPVFFSGDTLTFSIRATDQLGLTWVGYQLLGFAADSVAVTDSTGTLDASIVIQPGWDTPGALLHAFAWDVGGNRTYEYHWLELFSGIRRPLRRVVADPPGPLGERVYDPKRELLFLEDRTGSRIVVFSLNTLEYQGSIAAPSPPRGLDLTPSGDSLVMTFVNDKAIGIADLTKEPWEVSRLDLGNVGGRYPMGHKIAANGKAFVALDNSTGVVDSAFALVDLSTGTTVLRPEGTAQYVESTVLRSHDASVVVGFAHGLAYRYLAASDTVEGGFSIPSPASGAVNADGSYTLVGGSLYDRSFTRLATLFTSPWQAVAFTSDGQAVFEALQDRGGYRLVQVPDGIQMERVFLPVSASGLLATPDGNSLITFDSLAAPRVLVDLR